MLYFLHNFGYKNVILSGNPLIFLNVSECFNLKQVMLITIAGPVFRLFFWRSLLEVINFVVFFSCTLIRNT